MRLATLMDGTRDGRLVVVDGDCERYVAAGPPTLQAALEEWEREAPGLARLAAEVRNGAGEPIAARSLAAPLPRSHQYCEGSTYLSHMERCRAARRAPLPPNHGSDPAVLQSGSDRFLGPEEAIVLADESWGLDFEATLAAVVDDVSQGVDPAAAREHIRLLVLTNDLTLRHLLTKEFAKGVGFFQAKPARPFAPIAVSPGALGGAWRDGLLHARVDCHLNGERIGSLRSGEDAHFDFGQVIAHAARTRALSAGTIVGTGTISNRDAARGFACLAERRALELQQGRPPSPFLAVGDAVRIEAFDEAGRSIFGAMANPVRSTTAGAAR